MEYNHFPKKQRLEFGPSNNLKNTSALQLYHFGNRAIIPAGNQQQNIDNFKQLGVQNCLNVNLIYSFLSDSYLNCLSSSKFFLNGAIELAFVTIRYQFNTHILNDDAIRPPKRVENDCLIIVSYSLPLFILDSNKGLCGLPIYHEIIEKTLNSYVEQDDKENVLCLLNLIMHLLSFSKSSYAWLNWQ